MQDLILRNRVADYREESLFRTIHAPERPGFEHYLPSTGVLVAMPTTAWPYVEPILRGNRRSEGHYGRMDPKQSRLAKRILDQIKSEGPLCSDDIDHKGTVKGAWGLPGRASKAALETLFRHGRVLIRNRRNLRRIYDLPERVLPEEVLRAPKPTQRQRGRWDVLTLLRQRRLTRLRPKELALVQDLVQCFQVEGCPPLYALREDLPLLDQADLTPDEAPRLLAPLDPLIYDRRLISALWGFDYTWEVYTPAAKRVRGYYALPLLCGTRLVGHVDLKADRKAGKLNIVSRQVSGRRPYAPAVKELARFLKLAYP